MVQAALTEARAFYGSNGYVAMLSLLEALEAQYKDDLVAAPPERVAAKQAACQQVRALHRALSDREGLLQPTI